MSRVFTTSRIISAALLLAALVLFAAVSGVILNAPSNASEEGDDKKTISVTGQAKVSASPDIARINLGVVTEGLDAKVAQRENAESMQKVIAAIKASGIKDEDIITVNYSITPKYDYNKNTTVGTIVGYTVTNSVQVTVRDMSKIGSVIDAAAESGVNLSSSITFELSNYEACYNEALKNAVLAAKKKAGTIADALGVKLKGPVSLSEGGGYNPLRNYVTYDMKATAEAASTPIESGSIEITAYVNAVYEY